MPADYFARFLEYVEAEADYYVEATLRLQRRQPTDFLFFFLGSMDVLQHFQMHEKGWDTVRRGYKIVDNALGVLLRELEPENVMAWSEPVRRSSAVALSRCRVASDEAASSSSCAAAGLTRTKWSSQASSPIRS